MNFAPGQKVEECYTEDCLHSRQLLEDLTHGRLDLPIETKVAGRNVMVRTAIVFIAALSLCTALLILTMVLLSCCAIVLKAWYKSVLTGRIRLCCVEPLRSSLMVDRRALDSSDLGVA